MAVLTLKSEEFQKFPSFLREYASYLVAIRGNSEKTVCEYLLDIRTFFRYIKCEKLGISIFDADFERIAIDDVTIKDAELIKNDDVINFLMFTMSSRSNSTTTRMRKISSLRSLYNYLCNKRHYFENNPTIYIDRPKTAKTLPKYLSYDECLLLLETIRNDIDSPTNARDFAIIALFLNTGMRLSELTGLNLQSFSSDLSWVKVIGKGNKERIIYLNDFAKNAVREYLEVRLDPMYIKTSDKAFFLSSREQRISAKTVQWMAHKYFGMAGMGHRGLSVHKLRHTAATLMYQSGKVDIRVLKEVLGHEQLNTTQIYTHVVDRNLEEAVEKNPLADMKIKKPKL